jgi:hypothetical protein
MSKGQSDYREQQRRDQYHQRNLSAQDGGEGIQLLKELSENKDLPIQPEDDEIIGQFGSKATAEANLSDAEYESIQWEREIQILLWLCKQPTDEGMSGALRGWVHGDSEEELSPLTPKERAVVESFATTHKEVLSLSKEGFGVKESGRSVNQSIVDDGNKNGSSSGGLLDKLGL